ncbi:WYL domain-containing protein, partial [Lysinibacillus agricola]
MVNSQQNKGYHVISMFNKLINNQKINKKQKTFTHNVNKKTIQQNLNKIHNYINKAKLNCH